MLTHAAAVRAVELFDTPHKPRAMFRPDCLAAFDGDGRHRLLDAIAANETRHLRHARRCAFTTAAAMKARGADAVAWLGELGG